MDNLRSSPLGPLYFVLLKFWMLLFGDSEAALRAPSLLTSLLVIPVTYVIGVRAFSRGTALVGAVLLTLSPLQLYFAQEARMYMLLTLFAVLYFVAYLRWRDATSAPGALVWYAIAGTVMVYTNIISATLVLALNIDAFWLLARCAWRERRGGVCEAPHGGGRPGRAAVMWIVANAAITLAFLLYLLTVRFDAAGASQGWRGALSIADSLRALFEYPLVALHGVYYYAHDFSAAAAELQRYPSMPAFRRFLELFLVQPLTLIVVVLALGASAARILRGSRRAVVLAVVVPLAIGTVVSVSEQLDLTRYFLFASPFLFLLIGDGVTKMARAAPGATSGLLAFAIMLLTTAFGIRSYDRVDARDSDYRPVASTLARGNGAASVILVQPSEAAEPLAYYLRNEHTAPVRAVRPEAPIAASLPDVPGARAWLVLDYRSHLYGDSPDALRESVGALVLSDRYAAGAGGGVRLVLLETRGADGSGFSPGSGASSR